jgi:murein DD-endopeptidase MepM/ murein hydrolase activator NlpD
VTLRTVPGFGRGDLPSVPRRAQRLARSLLPGALCLALLSGPGCASPPPRPAPRGADLGPAPAPRPPPEPPRAPLPTPVPAPLAWPLEGEILSGFGAVRGRRHHQGIDIAAPRGTPVRAAAAGRVIRSQWMRGYGNVVWLAHGDGVESRYAHMHSLLVRRGEWVERGQPLGTVGATGNATTPHLHFEVRRAGRARNPLAWMPATQEQAAFPAARP